MFVTDDFYTAFLHRILAPVTAECLSFCRAWQKREGGLARYNPFNTEWKEPGSTYYNHTSPNAGVQNYVDMTSGVDATAKSIQQHYYINILSGFRSGNPWALIATMKPDFRTWSGGGYDTLPNPPQPQPQPQPPKRKGNTMAYMFQDTTGIYLKDGTQIIHVPDVPDVQAMEPQLGAPAQVSDEFGALLRGE